MIEFIVILKIILAVLEIVEVLNVIKNVKRKDVCETIFGCTVMIMGMMAICK